MVSLATQTQIMISPHLPATKLGEVYVSPNRLSFLIVNLETTTDIFKKITFCTPWNESVVFWLQDALRLHAAPESPSISRMDPPNFS